MAQGDGNQAPWKSGNLHALWRDRVLAAKPHLASLLRQEQEVLAVSWLVRAASNCRVAVNRALDPLSRMSPEDMALSVALGVVFGVFPAPACPTLLCALAAIVLRLNPSAIQAVNYLVSPLQLVLLAPLIRLGGRLFQGSSRYAATGSHVLNLHSTVWQAAQPILGASAQAIAAWLCVCAPVGLLLYGLLASALRRRLLRTLCLDTREVQPQASAPALVDRFRISV